MSIEILNTPENYRPFPDQVDALERLEAARQQNIYSGIINHATGTGKTDIPAQDIANMRRKKPDARVLSLCHNSNILSQVRERFAYFNPDVSHGNVIGEEVDGRAQFVYATIQKMNGKFAGGKRYQGFDPKEFDYVFVDEGHHGPAPTYREVIDYFEPSYMKLAATATPYRRDRQCLSSMFGPEISTYLLETAIVEGRLARPDYKVLTDHVKRLEQIQTDLGTISLKKLNREIFVRRRDGEIADMIAEHLWKRAEEGKQSRTVVFCENIAHAEHMAELLPGNLGTYHSKLPDHIQDKRLKAFKEGDLDMLLVVSKLDEGIDLPEANVGVFLRSTESRTVFLQQLGRLLRRTDGKDEALILDFVASWERIKDIKMLERAVNNAYAAQQANAPVHTKSPFSFDFSEESLRAIEVIEYARNQQNRPRPINPNKGKRVESWGQAEEAIKKMLSISRLPDQRLTTPDWRKYEKRIIDGDESAKNELLMRRLRTIYLQAERYANESENDLATVEDYFNHSYVKCKEMLDSYMPDSEVTLEKRIMAIPFKPGDLRSLSVKSEIDFPPNLTEDCSGIANTKPGLTAKNVAQIKADRAIFRSSLDEPQDEIDRTCASTEEEALCNIDVEDIRAVLERLPPRETYIARHVFKLEGPDSKTLNQLGLDLGISSEWVRQIGQQIGKKLPGLHQDYIHDRNKRLRKNPRLLRENQTQQKTSVEPKIIEATSVEATILNRARRAAETELFNHYPGELAEIDMTRKRSREDAVVKSLASKILEFASKYNQSLVYHNSFIRDARNAITHEVPAVHTVANTEYAKAVDFLISLGLLRWEQPYYQGEKPYTINTTPAKNLPLSVFDD